MSWIAILTFARFGMRVDELRYSQTVHIDRGLYDVAGGSANIHRICTSWRKLIALLHSNGLLPSVDR